MEEMKSFIRTVGAIGFALLCLALLIGLIALGKLFFFIVYVIVHLWWVFALSLVAFFLARSWLKENF